MWNQFLLVRSGFLCVNADLLAAHALRFKADYAVNLCKERIVLADANVIAGMEMRAALPNQDVAGKNELTVGPLRPKTLGLAVAAVTRAAHALFMREKLQIDLHHRVTPPFRLS